MDTFDDRKPDNHRPPKLPAIVLSLGLAPTLWNAALLLCSNLRSEIGIPGAAGDALSSPGRQTDSDPHPESAGATTGEGGVPALENICREILAEVKRIARQGVSDSQRTVETTPLAATIGETLLYKQELCEGRGAIEVPAQEGRKKILNARRGYATQVFQSLFSSTKGRAAQGTGQSHHQRNTNAG